MSANDDGPVASREIAYRLFAAEFDGADLEYSDSDEERAPNYVVTPTGARVNRLFVVGVLTEIEPVSDDVLRARVADPTGAFVGYAGQYQPEAVAFLEGAEVPSFVALTGKARTFQPEDSDRVFTSVRPESLSTVDAETRDRWTVQAAAHTLARIATMARALDRDERDDDLTRVLEAAGLTPGLASGTALAIDHYGTTRAYLSALREVALAAAGVAAGDRESAPTLDLSPDDDGPVSGDLTASPAVTGTLTGGRVVDEPGAGESVGDPSPAEASEPEAEPDGTDEGSTAAGDATTEPDLDAEPESADETTTADPDLDAEPESADGTPTAEPDLEAEAEPAEESGTAAGGSPEEITEEDPTADLGTFEAADLTDSATTDQYQLADDEREAVEAEYGTEFSTGSEVGDPGEAGIEPEAAPPSTDEDESEDDAPSIDDEEASEPAADGDLTASESETVDLEDAAVEAMATLDDGLDHGIVIRPVTVVEASGASAADVEAAIDDALMGGRCYEPGDGQLKAI